MNAHQLVPMSFLCRELLLQLTVFSAQMPLRLLQVADAWVKIAEKNAQKREKRMVPSRRERTACEFCGSQEFAGMLVLQCLLQYCTSTLQNFAVNPRLREIKRGDHSGRPSKVWGRSNPDLGDTHDTQHPKCSMSLTPSHQPESTPQNPQPGLRIAGPKSFYLIISMSQEFQQAPSLPTRTTTRHLFGNQV